MQRCRDFGALCGVGLGFKPLHYAEVCAGPLAVDFWEVHAENYMVSGGPMLRMLERLREHYPLSLHGVGLSIGGEAPMDAAHLTRLAQLVRDFEPALFSEHLAWSSHGGTYFNDLLPVPYCNATLQRVCEHVDQVQARLGRQLLLENPSTYLSLQTSTMTEAEFITAVVARTGCAVLLDINNVYVSAVNQGEDPLQALEAMPWQAVAQIHLAGHAQERDPDGGRLLIDDHGSAVVDAVWALYRTAIRRLGPTPTLIERDQNLPPLSVLIAEAEAARLHLQEAQRKHPTQAMHPSQAQHPTPDVALS